MDHRTTRSRNSVDAGNGVRQPQPNLDFFVAINRPTFEAMTEINGRMLEQLAAVNSAWMQFLQRRVERDMELPQQLAQCKSPQEFFRVYGEFLQNTVQQYQAEFAEMARRSQDFGNEAAGIMRSKVEEASREARF